MPTLLCSRGHSPPLCASRHCGLRRTFSYLIYPRHQFACDSNVDGQEGLILSFEVASFLPTSPRTIRRPHPSNHLPFLPVWSWWIYLATRFSYSGEPATPGGYPSYVVLLNDQLATLTFSFFLLLHRILFSSRPALSWRRGATEAEPWQFIDTREIFILLHILSFRISFNMHIPCFRKETRGMKRVVSLCGMHATRCGEMLSAQQRQTPHPRRRLGIVLVDNKITNGHPSTCIQYARINT